jgi:hypothetical protein
MAIVCTTCGHQCSEREDFCPSCGTFLDRGAATTARLVPAGPDPAPAPGPGPRSGGDGLDELGLLDPSAPEASPGFGDDVGRRADPDLDVRTTLPPMPSTTQYPDPTPAANPGPVAYVPTPVPPPPPAAVRPASVAPTPVAPAPAPTPAPRVVGSVAPTGVTCPACGTVNGVGERSCRRCGTAFPGPDLGRPLGHDAVSPIDAVQPGEAKARPGPQRVAPTAPHVVGGVACPRCGEANPRDRRFCSRCGLPMGAPGAATALAPPPRRSWWRRLVDRVRGRGPVRDFDEYGDDRMGASDAASKAYRRGLDLRYRVMRVVAVLAVLGIGAAALGVGGFNPRGWVRDGWHRLRGDQYQAVERLQATAEPAEEAPFHAEWAVDGIVSKDRAWTTRWTPPTTPVGECQPSNAPGGATSALVLTLAQSADVVRIRVHAGLGDEDADRLSEWRPTALDVEGDNGTCRRVVLRDEAGEQEVALPLGEVSAVRIAIVDATEPKTGDGDLVSIRELALLTER